MQNSAYHSLDEVFLVLVDTSKCLSDLHLLERKSGTLCLFSVSLQQPVCRTLDPPLSSFLPGPLEESEIALMSSVYDVNFLRLRMRASSGE